MAGPGVGVKNKPHFLLDQLGRFWVVYHVVSLAAWDDASCLAFLFCPPLVCAEDQNSDSCLCIFWGNPAYDAEIKLLFQNQLHTEHGLWYHEDLGLRLGIATFLLSSLGRVFFFFNLSKIQFTYPAMRHEPKPSHWTDGITEFSPAC